MTSLTWWTWVWASSGSWWWTGKPGVLHSMGSQRVRHDWETELNWTERINAFISALCIFFAILKDWGQKEKGVAVDEIVRYHHWLNGHEIEQTPRDSEGQRSLVCYNSWGQKKLNMTKWLNWTELMFLLIPKRTLDKDNVFLKSNWGFTYMVCGLKMILSPLNSETTLVLKILIGVIQQEHSVLANLF